ncbi:MULTISPECIES: mitofilin family membrane protein [unclassified Roseitalea]|uniref:COG4223 family protein n=1 Tax=unclassified Roseitalea TaxID=2639107 RepID=UPI00273F204F|nr:MULTISPECIES: mitofilin family membrane protein [unclassified Roseitalea]
MAKRTRPSEGVGRTSTRKPVTIDLEAERVQDKPSGPDEAAEHTDPDTNERAETETAAAPGDPAPEPVALGTSPGTADEADKADDTQTSGSEGTGPRPWQASHTDEQGDGDDEPQARPSASGRGEEAPPPQRRRGGLGAVLGGIIGGLIALAGAAGLQWGGVLPSLAPQPEPPAPVDLTPLQGEIAQLEGRIDDLAAAQDAPAPPVEIPPEITERIEAANQAAQSAGSQAAEAQSAIDTLAGQVQQLRSAISAGEAGEGAGLGALASRVDALEPEIAQLAEQVDRLASAAAETPGGQALSDIEAALEATSGNVEALRADVEALGGDVGTLDEEVAALRTRLGEQLAALGERVADNQAAIAQAQQRIEEGGADSSAVARAIAATALKTAIDRGSAFMSELETYASTAGEDETVAALRDFAASGVPTVSQLVDRFDAVASRIVATGQGLDEDASLADRLMSSARSLVQVRPVGETAGETPGAIAARIETRLKAGELEAAIAQWETLPDAARRVSDDFMEQVRARLTVDQLVAGALDTAMAAAPPATPSQ